MARRSEGTGGAWRAWLVPLCVFALVAAGSVFGWLATERSESRLVETENELGSEQIAIRIEEYLRVRLGVVMQFRDLALAGGNETDLDRFAANAAIVLERHPEFAALNWTDSDGIIRRVVPHEPNVAALGRDLTQHPVAAAILQSARESGEPRMTPTVELYQGGRGFAVYVPMVRDGRTLGFVNAVFRIAPLIEDCLARGVRDHHYFELRDGADLLYRFDEGAAGNHSIRARRDVRVADRTWSLTVFPTPSEASRSRHLADEFVLLFGLFSGAVLAYTARRIIVGRRQVASSRERLRRVVQDMPAMICRYRPDTTLTFVNQAYADHVGRSRDELIGASFLADCSEQERREALERLAELTPELPMRIHERRVDSPTGARWEEWRDRAVFDESGRKILEYQSIGVDVTQRRRLELRLRQAQKMEAIGTLAGGVAHDFNNILTAIMGHAEIARSLVHGPRAALESLDGIEDACERATGVTRGLLTFSREQLAEKRRTELGDVVTETLRMLRPILPAAVDVRAELPQRDVWVEVDRTQMQQVLMNLALNARDAMPDGGTLSVTLEATPPGDRGSDRALLVVRDTGVGMTETVRERALEPFFTTKARERGTGLGMAVVHGIVVEHGGRMEIDSAPGAGTAVSIRLPLATPALGDTAIDGNIETAAERGSRVLVVEDDDQVRELFSTALRRRGYVVREAADGHAARQALLELEDELDAVVLDVDLPKLSGSSVLTHVRAAGCRTPVVLVSGDASHGLGDNLPEDVIFMQKPFALSDLASAVADMIGAQTPRAEA